MKVQSASTYRKYSSNPDRNVLALLEKSREASATCFLVSLFPYIRSDLFIVPFFDCSFYRAIVGAIALALAVVICALLASIVVLITPLPPHLALSLCVCVCGVVCVSYLSDLALVHGRSNRATRVTVQDACHGGDEDIGDQGGEVRGEKREVRR